MLRHEHPREYERLRAEEELDAGPNESPQAPGQREPPAGG